MYPRIPPSAPRQPKWGRRDEFTCRVSTVDGQTSQIASVVIQVLPEIDPQVSSAVAEVALGSPLVTLFDGYLSEEPGDGSRILEACRREVDPTSMFVPPLQANFEEAFSWNFTVSSLAAVTGDFREGTGVINVSYEVASVEDGQGNWFYSELVYSSYSFDSSGDHYSGERITRLEAFAVNDVAPYGYVSLAVGSSVVASAVTWRQSAMARARKTTK